MDIARIEAILIDSLGEVDQDRQATKGSVLCNFFVESVVMETEKVHHHAAEMIELLKEWPHESWGHPVEPLGGEISYIMAGAILDDQRRALRLFAFGKIAGWWGIMDPHTMLGLDYDNDMGRQLAGRGLVSIMGYKPKATV